MCISHTIDSPPGSAVVRFEPFLEDAYGTRRLALRVLRIVGPVEYVATAGNRGAITEGSFLRYPTTGKVLTVDINHRRYRDLDLLWPDQSTMSVASF
jgi:hypothetical protein